MSSNEKTKYRRHPAHEGIGTITALLTIITLSIIFVSILSII